MIKQSTGEDWNNASISLSTAQPDIGGSPPQLGVHHIGFLRPRAVAVKKGVPVSTRSYFMDEYDPTIEDEEFSEEFPYSGLSLRSVKKVKSKKFGKSPSLPSLEIDTAKV